MQLLISQSAGVARFAFPNQRGLVASPGSEMPIETVVGNIELAANKPLRVRRLPLQNRVALFEPIKFFSHPRPKLFRIGARFSAQRFKLFHRFDVRSFGETPRWREYALLVKHRFDISGSG